jgi:hypothetical protein
MCSSTHNAHHESIARLYLIEELANVDDLKRIVTTVLVFDKLLQTINIVANKMYSGMENNIIADYNCILCF